MGEISTGLLDISRKIAILLKTFNSEFSCIKIWFTDQSSKLLEVEYKMCITLVINQCVKQDVLFNWA